MPAAPDKERAILAKFLPPGSVDTVYGWIKKYAIHLKITPGRKSKFGDYRAGLNGQPHRISINSDLNPYAFLLTFSHEMAHLLVFEKHGLRAKPHGHQWKSTFAQIMQPFLFEGIYPTPLLAPLQRYLQNPSASSMSNLDLSRALQHYNTKHSNGTPLEQLAPNSRFTTLQGRPFIKQETLRKRIKCICLNSKRLYLFNPLTPVLPQKAKDGQ